MFIGTSGLITKEYTILSKDIPDTYNGLKMIHFSDLHYNNSSSKKLVKIVNEINLINPDIVVFTGDLINDEKKLTKKEEENLIKQLQNISTKYGKYAILGNHDYEYSDEKIKNILISSNFTILKNTYDIIYNEEGDKIYLGGIDDIIIGNPNLNDTLKYFETNENIYSIFLVHEPDYTTSILNKKDINLILAGHSHNGQVRLPWFGAIYTPNGAKKYYKNHYTINNTDLYISSGIGTSDINIRLFNRPSINFYRINKKK